MESNPKVKYEIITGTVDKVKEQLNDPIRANWRPILMSTISVNKLAVLLEIPQPQK
jgi:hypothetical protein